MEENKQYRNFSGIISNFSEEGRIVEGYAIRFNEESQNLGFYETISRGAITEELIKSSDIYARLNHREDTVLARSRYGEGSLELELTDEGLKYRFTAPHTAIGDELLEHIKRGEISTSSFAFSIDEEDKTSQRWYKEDGKIKRTINKIARLYDVSPTFEGAYLTTSCSSRSLGKDIKTLSEKVDKKMQFLADQLNKL